MLAPDDRRLYTHCLQAPEGHRFDQGLATTFTLDLETVLILPFTLVTQQEADPDQLISDPVALLEGLREATQQLTVFCQDGRIHVPDKQQILFGMLEDCVVTVRPPNPRGVFHPKLWLLRFVRDDPDEPPLLRVVVLSRNLTFDRSWDCVVSLEGRPGAKEAEGSDELADFVRALPGMAAGPVGQERLKSIEDLASEVRRTVFEAPEPFEGQARFHAIGLSGRRWTPNPAGKRILAVSPFLTGSTIRAAGTLGKVDRILVAREDELNDVAARDLDGWEVKILGDSVQTGDRSDAGAGSTSDDRERMAPSDGLHAKVVVVESGRKARWWLGSANLTEAAWAGRNVELVVELGGRRKRIGIDTFLDGGFRDLLTPYVKTEPSEEARARQAALKAAEAVRDLLLEAGLNLRCVERDEGKHDLHLEGECQIPPGVEVEAWPVTLNAGVHSLALEQSASVHCVWSNIAVTSLSLLIGFAVTALSGQAKATIRFVLKLPGSIFPEDRQAHLVRAIVNNRRGFFRYLRLLLALDDRETGLERSGSSRSSTGEGTRHGSSLSLDQVVLEDLVRALSRDPSRLQAVDKLVQDLLETDEGREVIPDEFLALWSSIQSVLKGSA